MKAQQKKIVILYLKNDEMNWAPITQQTQNIREKTNEKIRIFGNKYYTIKNILDKYKFKRDDLFMIAKDLENEYKNIKANIHLQNQLRRMKEALICWFCENFYNEITQPNSILLKRMIEKTKVASSNANVIHKNKNVSSKSIKSQVLTHTCSNKTTKEVLHQRHFPEYKINQEIDSFDFANMTTDISNDKSTKNEHGNENFNFDKFFNF